ncbi:hypothetical protein THIOM_004476 [Candidatus Thiomargarita nelsonii]|uniref:Uncharacterized protein n=1 Tax=Candidatus Thiomargarita nelsonii TaxID=1003181 RepID=A0A176RVS0_9GAMM|nr:hypothetical protein THIOM_004476 [Candidatus Thiomargarita nelsonii]
MPNQIPTYSLEEICKAAKMGNISYQGKSERPQIDAMNLGYSQDEIVKCLCSLSSSQFIESKKYTTPRGNKKVTFDVYIATCTNSEGQLDNLYIKLRLSSSWLIIGSFHLPR